MRVRAGLLALAVAGAALTLVWRLAPTAAPPLYDGCITEPYRYLGGSPAPVPATQHYQPTSDFQPSEVITGEAPAQGQVLLMTGTFVSSVPFVLTVEPVQQPRQPPPGQRYDGNVYRIVATASTGAQLQPQAGVLITVVLRGTTAGGPQRTIVRLDGSTWTPLSTVMAGCGDEYEATTDKLGDFAIVQPAGSSATPQPGGFPIFIVIVVIAAVLVAAIASLLLFSRPEGR